MCHSLRRWLTVSCSGMLGVFGADVCSSLCQCSAQMPLEPTLAMPCLWPLGCRFAQPVPSLPTSNRGPEQQIEQTPDPRALNSSELCILRSWHGLRSGYPPYILTSTFADSPLGEGEGAGHTGCGYLYFMYENEQVNRNTADVCMSVEAAAWKRRSTRVWRANAGIT